MRVSVWMPTTVRSSVRCVSRWTTSRFREEGLGSRALPLRLEGTLRVRLNLAQYTSEIFSDGFPVRTKCHEVGVVWRLRLVVLVQRAAKVQDACQSLKKRGTGT